MIMHPFFYVFLALIMLMHSPATAEQQDPVVDPAWEDLTFRIEDSRAFVGVAPIYLTVSKLTPEDGNLVGYYQIRVPLMASKNDRGKIILPLDTTVGEIGAKGGVLKGEAHSETDQGTINDIVCVIIPHKDQAIQLAITTKERTINFKSRYSIIESGVAKSDS